MKGRMIMRLRSTCVVLLVAGSLVAGCKRAPEPPPENEPANVATPEAPPPEPPQPAPMAVEIEHPKAKPAPELTADQQIIDDADATGMTSRASHSDDGAETTGGGNSER
jgi:hypothetical protein